MRIAVPAYFGINSDWSLIEQAGGTVGFIVLEFSFLGLKGDSIRNAQEQFNRCFNRGQKVLGYVHTKNGAGVVNSAQYPDATAEAVKKYVDQWFNIYQLDGIFFDEGPDPGSVPVNGDIIKFYRAIYDYVNKHPNARGNTVMLNASEFKDEWVMGPEGAPRAADVAVLFEGSAEKYEDRYVPQPWLKSYPPDRTAHVIHTCRDREAESGQARMVRVILRGMEHGVGLVYVFDGTSKSYSHLPAYWSAELDAVRDICTMIGPTIAEDRESIVKLAQAKLGLDPKSHAEMNEIKWLNKKISFLKKIIPNLEGQFQSHNCPTTPPPEDNPLCEQISQEIDGKRGQITILQEEKDGLDPRVPGDRARIVEIIAEIESLRRDIRTLQQQAQALNCPS